MNVLVVLKNVETGKIHCQEICSSQEEIDQAKRKFQSDRDSLIASSLSAGEELKIFELKRI